MATITASDQTVLKAVMMWFGIKPTIYKTDLVQFFRDNPDGYEFLWIDRLEKDPDSFFRGLFRDADISISIPGWIVIGAINCDGDPEIFEISFEDARNWFLAAIARTGEDDCAIDLLDALDETVPRDFTCHFCGPWGRLGRGNCDPGEFWTRVELEQVEMKMFGRVFGDSRR